MELTQRKERRVVTVVYLSMSRAPVLQSNVPRWRRRRMICRDMMGKTIEKERERERKEKKRKESKGRTTKKRRKRDVFSLEGETRVGI